MQLCDKLKKILDKNILRIEENPKSGMNNRTYIVRTVDEDYLYRMPCEGTELFADRAGEVQAYHALASRNITDIPVYLDADSGEKITVYYPDSHTCDPGDDGEVSIAIDLLRRFHRSDVKLQTRENLWMRMLRFGRIAASSGSDLLKETDYAACIARLDVFRHLFDDQPICPIHGDALPGNFLFPGGGSPVLIDLEFASIGCIYEDLADFCHDAGYTPERSKALLNEYLQRAPAPEEERCLFVHIAAVALMWSGWAAFKAEKECSMRTFFEQYKDMSVKCASTALNYIETKIT